MNTQSHEASPVLMPKRSRYAGQPAHIAGRRSIVLQTTNLSNNVAVFDYFFHEDDFWQAVMPLDSVDLIYGQAINFSKKKMKRGNGGREVVLDKFGVAKGTISCLNHIQLRFVLKPGTFVDLYPLGTEVRGAPVHRINDFIYSLEAVPPTGVRFNLYDAFWGHFIAAHRFVSTTDVVFERIVVENYYIRESPPIPLSDSEKKSILVESLKRSHQAGDSEPYFLFHLVGTNNCTSTPFHIVDKVRDYGFLQRLATMLYRIPWNPRLYLRVRGLRLDPSVHKHLRTVFGDFINDPQLRERKRKYLRSLRK